MNKEPRKALRIFDFDDTLVRTDAAVTVKKQGKHLKSLSSLSFKDYILGKGEEFDFSAADSIVNPKPIGAVLKVLRKIHAKGSEAVILTGRKKAHPVKNWLNSVGLSDVEVVAIGHDGASHRSIAKAKRKWIVDAIGRGYNDIEFWDDNEGNIKHAESIKQEFPNIKFRTRLVKYKPKGVTEERNYRSEYLKMYGGDSPSPKQRLAMKKKTARKRVLRKMGREGTSNDGKEIDHKDGNALNGSRSNLRLVSVHTNRSKDNNKWR